MKTGRKGVSNPFRSLTFLLRPAKEYLKFLFKSTNQHGIHSPFAYDFVSQALYREKDKGLMAQWRAARKFLLNNHQRITVTDLGAGSHVFKNPQRKISAIAKNAGASQKKAQLLSSIVAHRRPKRILELGTSLGLGSLALSLPKKGTLTTVEACPNSLKVAQDGFKRHQLDEFVITENLDFDTYLDGLAKETQFDLVLIDGNHTYEATWRYFKKLSAHLHSESLLILDDLYWSKGMTQAWQEICSDQRVRISIDGYDLGFLFFRSGNEKEHYRVRL